MSPEISALIGSIQVSLRSHAGIPLYDPTDPSLPSLPTIADTVSSFNPSNHFRCIHCRGPLIRGAESTICVFCGADRRRDAPEKSFSYKDTVGCKNLLQVLGFDGSEDVTLDTESRDSNEGLDEQKEAMLLSDLLDLELRWPLDKGKISNISLNKVSSQLPLEKEGNDGGNTKMLLSQSSFAMNVSGVDIDSFFSDSKKDTTSSSEQLTQINNIDSQESPDSQNFGFGGNFQTSDVSVSTGNTKDGQFGESFADWDANFQSAPQSFATESTSVDLFQGSSQVSAPAPAPAPAAYTYGQKSEREHNPSIIGPGGERGDNDDLHSSRDNWISDDIWSQMSKESINTSNQFKGLTEAHTAGSKDLNYTTDVSDSRVQDVLWLSSDKQELNSTKNIEETDDLFDVWQDFTSSGNAQAGVSNISPENVSEASSAKEINANTIVVDNDDLFDAWQDFSSSSQATGGLSIPWLQNGTEVTASGNDSVPMSTEMHDMDFGSFLGSDSLKVLGDKQGHQEAQSVPLDSPVLERINGTNEKSDVDLTTHEESSETISATQHLDSTDSNVHNILSQMHDLSFMLENNLSIPNKTQGSGLNS